MTEPSPLHDPELESLGDRLAEAARALLVAADCRTAKDLAERAKIDGTTARRVIRMVAENAGGSVVLTRAPSHAHLQRLANQARTQGMDPQACDALHDAAADFAALLRRRGISRAMLTKLIRDDREGLLDDGDGGDRHGGGDGGGDD